MTWKQTCVHCGSDRLRKTLDGLSLACVECDRDFPAIVDADGHPPGADVKLHGPPGTGKTTQLVRRIEELLRSGRSLADMCIVTYRKEMARDILSQLYARELISAETLRKPWASDARFVGTLHAICNRLVDVDPPDGLEGHKGDFCRERYGIRYFRDSEETEPTAGELMFQCRSWVIENVVEWDLWDRAPMYDQLIETWVHHPTLERFHYEWEDWKAQQGISDFDDMLLTVHEDDVEPPTSIVAADEYHDFTPIQHEIVSGWLDRDRTDVAIVDGDPLQVVYSYAGADADFYRGLDLDEVLLPRSFRVPSTVWKYAERVLEPQHDAPPIEPKEATGEVLERDSARLDKDVSTDSGGLRPRDFVDEYGEDIMLLTRTRAQARDVAGELRDAGVITYGQEGTGAWNHSRKRLAIYNCLQRLDGVATPESVSSSGQGRLDAFGSTSTGGGDDGIDPQSVDLYAEDLDHFLDRVPAEYFADETTKKTALPKLTGESKIVSADELGEYVAPEFFEIFTTGADAISELLKYDGRDVVAKALRRYDESVAPYELQDRVNVLTIHAAKGQESNTVILYDGITKRVSTSLTRLKSEERNEARLWYVGCTRAAERLVVSRGGWNWIYPYLPDLDQSEAPSSAGARA